ncbi:MAG: tetratricopeptide repeat protein [Candidatus Aminicenantes bacterium]|nr:tetratricopeptide repeat protein [Candidatus Aminicenantes bacterium]
MKKTTRIFLWLFICFLTTASFSSALQEEAEALNESDKAVVTLVAYDANNKEVATGKAVLISADGYALTSYHLICQAESAEVEIPKVKTARTKVDWESVFSPTASAQDAENKKQKSKGKRVEVLGIVAVDKNLDLALLKIKGQGHPSAPLCLEDKLVIGSKNIVVADEDSVADTSITGIVPLTKTQRIAQCNITIPPEMSGSPLFNSAGEVTGIACSAGEIRNLIFPASYAQHLMQSKQVTPLDKIEHENYFATPEGLYLKGLAYALMENNANAIGLIQESLRLKPGNPDALAQMGSLYSKMRQYDKASEYYTQALGVDPDNFRTAYELGVSYIKLNKPDQAVAPLEQSTQKNPDFPDAYYNLGLAYQSLDQLENAARAFEEFVKINPGPAWTGLNQLGSIYMELNQYEKAVTAFEEVIKTNPDDLKAHYNMALAHDNLRNYDQAAVHYRKLIELNPKDSGSYYNFLFRLYDKAGDFENAILVSQEIIDLAPDNPQNHYNSGYAYLKKEDYANALSAFQKALELNPGFDLAYFQIGFVHFKQQKYAEAIDALTKFTELKPDNPDAFYLLGTSHLQLKQYEKALQPLVKCTELKEDHAYAHYNLGIAYYVLKDRYSANMKIDLLQKLNPELAEKLRQVISR